MRVLIESIRLENQHGYRAVDYHMQLKDAFAELGWKDEYRKKLWEIVAAWRVQYKRRSAMTDELKALSNIFK